MTRFNWIIVAIILILLSHGCQKDLSPRERAFELARNSSALGGEKPVGRFIEDWLDENQEEVKAMGWKVTLKDDKTYIVSYHYMVYSFEKGTGERTFSFEVNLDTETVKDITEKIEEQMMPLEKPLQDESEVSQEILKEYKENGEL